jgi:uncharacterized glyoxalase superfamily protein PhnB
MGSRLVPALRYRNVPAAIDWLCGAFGFERHDVVTAVDGTILHARLMFGNDMILILPVRDDSGVASPAGEAGAAMQSCYFVVDDADMHYQHAKASGAEILDITEYDYGGRGYSCRDPEGHLWNFGTYDPRRGNALVEHWPKQPPYWQTVANDLRLRTVATLQAFGDKINPPVIVAAVVAAVIAAATVGWLLVALPNGSDKRLTFRSVASPPQETAAQQPAARTQVNSLALRPAPQQADDAIDSAARQASPPPPAPSRVNSPAFAAVGTQSDAEPAKETAERNAEEALKQLRAAQRTAGEAFRQLREASAGEPAAAPAPAESRRQIAKAVPDQHQLQVAREQQAAREQQIAREQQLARERAARESAALIEQQLANERAAAERAKLSAVAPAREPARPPQEQKSDPFWDCQPDTATGQVVCNPTGKKPVAAAPAATPKPKVTAAEPVPAAAPAPTAQKPQQADNRLWDCQPKPTTGEVVCRPMGPAKQQ